VYSIKGTKNLIDVVIPFFKKYVVVYSSKYKSEVFNNFCQVLNKLDRNYNVALSQEELIKLVKLIYLINPEGKGKQRKRTLQETLDIINSSN
jgi:RNA recognition motif-containing protein